MREGAGGHGRVGDRTWQAAIDAGWTAADLVEAFAIVALTWFVDGFAAFAEVALDAPRAEVAAARAR